MGDEVLATMPVTAGRALHLGAELRVLSAFLSIGRVVARDLLEGQRPTCRTCDPKWLVTAGRHAALTGDVARAYAIADELAAPERGASPAAGSAKVRALAHARAGRRNEADAQASEARTVLRAAGNRLAIDRFERDLAAVSTIPA